MTGLAGFCAYAEVVQVTAPAINKRKSRRLARSLHSAEVESAHFMAPHQLTSRLRSQHIPQRPASRDGIPPEFCGPDLARGLEINSEYRDCFIKALDLTAAKVFQRALSPDACGDHSVHQDFPVCGRCAQAGREIYNAADGGVVETVLVTDLANRCRSTSETDAESDVVALRSPAGDEILHALLH